MRGEREGKRGENQRAKRRERRGDKSTQMLMTFICTYTHTHTRSFIGASVDQSNTKINVIFYSAVPTTSRAGNEKCTETRQDPLHGLTFRCPDAFRYTSLPLEESKKKQRGRTTTTTTRTTTTRTTAVSIDQDAEMETVQAAQNGMRCGGGRQDARCWWRRGLRSRTPLWRSQCSGRKTTRLSALSIDYTGTGQSYWL